MRVVIIGGGGMLGHGPIQPYHDDCSWLKADVLTGAPDSPLYPRKQTWQR
jgi:hypothetical protein